MIQRRFFSDQHARIPFSIIGIFLLLGSSLTTVYISRLELEKSEEITRSLDIQEIEDLLNSFEADLTNALNLAGMKATKEIGKHPVIASSLGTSQQINQFRLKSIIKEELTVFLMGHYLSNTFSNGQYALNVILENGTPILSIGNISVQRCVMQLERFSIPFIGPPGTVNHTTYFVVSFPLQIEIRRLEHDTWNLLTNRTVSISSIITSRYPLLESLMNEYHETINGTFSPLWTYTTAVTNLYSLLRGFKHYRCGRPLNVMDNRHLSVIINGGLLLEQSLVFGSVTPLGLVDFAKEIKQSLKQTPSDVLTIFNEEMEGEGYIVEPENLSKGTANIDAGFPVNESIDCSMCINLSEIAERILYTVSNATFHFENDAGDIHDEFIPFKDDVQTYINELLLQQANQSFYLTNVTKHLTTNQSTLHQLETIISEIYHDTMSTEVLDRYVVSEQWGDPGENWLDGGTTPWNATTILPVSKQNVTPPKGQVNPQCAVYQENYTVSYERTHSWWQTEEQTINGTTIPVTVWNNKTDLLNETVLLQDILEHWSSYKTTQDDTCDVLYFNETLQDNNLKDTIDSYLAIYNDSNGEKQTFITTRNNTGIIGLNADVSGVPASWVYNEAWNKLEEIFESVRQITLDPYITKEQYPNPGVFLEEAQNNLLAKYTANISSYLEYSLYHPDSQFLSVGKKAVYYIRDWYVETVQNITNTVFSEIQQQLTNALETAIPSSVDFITRNITQVVEDTSDAIQNQMIIPFGYDMNLSRYDSQKKIVWNETIRVAVDQSPRYLDPFKKTSSDGEELWTIKIRNRCIFGPTGLPLLPPSPVTVWLVTLNLWVIDVQGEYPQFKIIDSSDETIFNPLLGHEPQSYVRELKVISVGNVTLGQNTRLSFGFTTVAFGLVPSWGMMLGDIQEDWFDEHTPGFTEESSS
jgi:hypothetical protein